MFCVQRCNKIKLSVNKSPDEQDLLPEGKYKAKSIPKAILKLNISP